MEEVQMAVQPLEDRILVQPLEAEGRTESGIYLPESAKEKPMQGKVVACGPGKRLDNGERIKPTVKKGDTVVFGKYSGTEVEVKNVTHLIVRESELLGLVE
jgi:chaperonin GroES